MSGWNKTKKHNQDSPTNQKVHKELNFQCFHSEIWLQSVICFAPQNGTECWEKLSLLSLLGPTWWEAVGTPGKPAPGQSAGCRTAFSSLQNSTEPPGAASAGWTKEPSPQNMENQDVAAARGQDFVLLHGLHI